MGLARNDSAHPKVNAGEGSEFALRRARSRLGLGLGGLLLSLLVDGIGHFGELAHFIAVELPADRFQQSVERGSDGLLQVDLVDGG